MKSAIFLWGARNREHIATHDVAADEAEYVIEHAQPPYPQKSDDEKRIVWGQTRAGRFLQVVFVQVLVENVKADEFEQLEFHERLALNDGDPAIRVIHARELKEIEKKQLRRRKRGR